MKSKVLLFTIQTIFQFLKKPGEDLEIILLGTTQASLNRLKYSLLNYLLSKGTKSLSGYPVYS